MHGNLDLVQILLSSGPVVKFVLLLLVIGSLLSWGIIFQKYKEFKKVAKADLQFLDKFKSNLALADLFQQSVSSEESSLGLMFRLGYEEMNKMKEKSGSQQNLAKYLANSNSAPLERVMKSAMTKASEKLELRLTTLASIGSIAPFVGLFGTVWGIIDAFSGLASGGGSIEAVAPGIAEALVATAVGLAAAIPSVWFYNFFNAKIASFLGQMDSFSQDFLNLIERNIIISHQE